MKNIQISAIMLAAAVTALSLSCDRDSKEGKPLLSVTPSTSAIVVAANGKSATSDGQDVGLTFTVETNQKTWNVTSNQKWVNAGKLDNTFTLIVAEAGLVSPDEAEITVTAGNATPVVISVKQLFSDFIGVKPGVTSVIFSADGTTATSGNKEIDPTFEIETNVASGEWKAVSNRDWLTVDMDEQNNTFTLSAAANTFWAPEDAEVTVTSGIAKPVKISVSQIAALDDMEGDLLDMSNYLRWNPEGIPYVTRDANYEIEKMWNDIPGEHFAYNFITFTFDLGQTAILTKFKIWQAPYPAYSYANLKKFRLWGSDHPDVTENNNTWTFMGDYTSIKPSGLPGTETSDEDVAFALAGEEMTIRPQHRFPTRYIRVDPVETWRGDPWAISIERLCFYGITKWENKTISNNEYVNQKP